MPEGCTKLDQRNAESFDLLAVIELGRERTRTEIGLDRVSGDAKYRDKKLFPSQSLLSPSWSLAYENSLGPRSPVGFEQAHSSMFRAVGAVPCSAHLRGGASIGVSAPCKSQCSQRPRRRGL